MDTLAGMAESEPATGDLYFDVDARHVRQLGRELVADRVTAISELVKNAYDADATKVILSFEGATNDSGGTLSILDDGSGMTFDDVRNRWMTISTDSKESAPVSPVYGRQRAGRKGIGRFAAETLGRHLRLETTVAGSTDRVIVTFNWDRDFVAGKALSDVPNRFAIEQTERDSHWTLLTIGNLYSAWTSALVKDVQRAIMFLQPPFPVSPTEAVRDHPTHDPGFGVDLVMDGSSEVESEASLNELFDSSTALITAEIDADGGAIRKVTSKQVELDETELVDNVFSGVGPLTLSAHYFIYKRDALGSIGARIAQRMGFAYGGVRVYRDGLRILPYGEHRDDWLGLDEQYRRRSILFPIGNTNYFGEVHLSREGNPNLIDTASREGLIENESFVELRRFTFETLVWGAQRVASIRKRKEKAGGSASRPPTRAAMLRTALAAVSAAVDDGPASQDTLRTAVSTLETLVKEAEDADASAKAEVEELAGELELLRILASLGTSIAVFSHEIRGVVDRTASAIGDLEELKSVTDTEPLQAAQQALQSLDELGQYIDGYVGQARIREKVQQPIFDVAKKFKEAFSEVMNGRGIEFSLDIDPPYMRTTPMTRSELIGILFNLLTNSIKAMDQEGHRQRAVRLSGRESATKMILRFEDTGVGIPDEIQDRVFDPFFTTTTAGDSELGVGTGLGLKIVADTLESYKGTIRLSRATPPFVTCFEITIPLWVGG